MPVTRGCTVAKFPALHPVGRVLTGVASDSLKVLLGPQGKREPFHFYRKRHNPRAHVEEEWVVDKVRRG